VRAAFETVDRDYGAIANFFSHSMMDGHVAHHLFFNRIPHYNLLTARDRIVAGLEKDGYGDLYKYVRAKRTQRTQRRARSSVCGGSGLLPPPPLIHP
jgi:fatty acid desaturase